MFKKDVNSSLTRILLYSAILFTPFFVFSQKDTVQTYKEVSIRGEHRSAEQSNTINRNQIEDLSPYDLGTLLQYINGITIRNYGGIGGMKTFSSRGLGGEHTQLIIDGSPVNDTQNGQINFSTIQTNNIEKVSVNYQNQNQMLPVTALIKGNNIVVTTYEQQFSPHPFSTLSSLTVGSFGQKEIFIAAKKAGKKNFFSLSGGAITYRGDYPYHLDFTNETKTHLRKNNALDNFYLSVGSGFKWDKNNQKHILKVVAKANFIDQQLPGAVVLYNNLSKETLQTKNTNAGVKYDFISKNVTLKTFVNYSFRYLRYYDPSYLNSDGFIENKYYVNSIVGGFILKYKYKDFSFFTGNDFAKDDLLSNRNLGSPMRYSNVSMLKMRYDFQYFYTEVSFFAQFFFDYNKHDNHENKYHRLHPHFSVFTSDKLFEKWQFSAWYKPSSRAPSFNELYFSQVGNKALIPEESSQLNIGIHYSQSFRKFDFQVKANAFKNEVKEKILALPTKNLFIWSIQNIGNVNILGGDLHFTGTIRFNQNWRADFQVGTSYQEVIDVSDKKSSTYRHQIAYTPKLTGNSSVNINYKNAGINLSTLYIGERYSLNENISSNLLNPYLITDISASYLFKIKSKNTVKIQAGIKNVTNESYSFIRYFVMPEINYFIKLSYEFN